MAVNRKHSKKRDAILETMRSTSSHPSAHWIYEQLKPTIAGLSLATVYRNIKLFQEEGRVVSVGVVDGKERFDGFVDPHPHFICIHCGDIIDLPLPNSYFAESALENYKTFTDFSIDYQKTVFYGSCKKCVKNSSAVEKY